MRNHNFNYYLRNFNYHNLNQLYNWIIIITVLALLLVVVLKIKTNRQKRSNKKLKELKIMPRKKADGLVFGKINGKKLVCSPTDSEGCCLCTAGTGMGKTSALGIPTLRAWGEKNHGNVWVIDISGDISKNTPKPNKLIFEPENLETIPYDIFYSTDIIKETAFKNESLEQLALLLMPEELGSGGDSGKFFLTNGRKILTASLIAFYHQGMDFTEICRIIMENSFTTLFEMIDATGNADAILYINSFQGSNEKNTAGCKQACDDSIRLFVVNESVKNCVRRPREDEQSLNPVKIESHNVFIIVDDPKLELYSPLLNIIVSQQMQYISNRKVNKDSAHILLFLDEYASLRINAQMILEALRKYRKRLCRLMVLTQNLADFDILYGHDTTKALLANFRFKVLMGGLAESESQKIFAEMIGYKEVRKRSVSRSANSSSTTTSTERELIFEPAELDRMGDKCILISPDGEGYMVLEKNFYFK